MRSLLFLLLLFFASCELKVNSSPDPDDGQPAEKQTAPSRSRGKIRNNIRLESTGGVQVEQAFLTYEEDGSFVSDSNVTTINKPVKLTLVVKGWKANEGKVFIDASQKITTSEGDVVLDEKGMLDALGGIKTEDAGYLSFRFVITRLYKLFDYFLVEVQARNKNADQLLKATFKMHVE